MIVEYKSGNVGIGNTVPNATLDVSGNIYLSAANPYVNSRKNCYAIFCVPKIPLEFFRISGLTIRKSGSDIVISD